MSGVNVRGHKLPIYNISQIQQRRDKLIHQVFAPLGEVTLRGHQVDLLVRELQRNLPQGIADDVLFESVRHLAGQVLDWRLTATTAWRLAGNIPRLKGGYPVGPWMAQQQDEWIPMLVLQALLVRNDRGRIGYNVTMRVLAGTPCPMKTTIFWSRELMGVLTRHVGFSQPWNDYPYHHGTEFVGLRIMGRVDPVRSHHVLHFSEYDAAPSMYVWNRVKVLKLRKRVGINCPRNWTHPCHLCAVGYNDCVAGTHRLTYEQKLCLICGELGSFFDEDISTDRCIACARIERLDRHV